MAQSDQPVAGAQPAEALPANQSSEASTPVAPSAELSIAEAADALTDTFQPMPELIQVTLLIIVSVASFLLCRRVLLPIIQKLVAKTKTSYDDILLDRRVLSRASWLVAGASLIIYNSLVLEALKASGEIGSALSTLADNIGFSILIFAGMFTIGAIADAAHTIYNKSDVATTRPIKGYIQIVKLILYIGGSIVGIAVLADKDPTVFLTGLGAMTAVLLLVFKDTILSLVASIQIASNDMLRVGDWLEMPSVGADGDVIDIALHTVKVQNWDKTISTIPTHKLITGSFKNWRGMSESGGRRIKRSITIDIGSVRFLGDAEIQQLTSHSLLHDYLNEKCASILAEDEARQETPDTDKQLIPNARKLTNIGTFRAWLCAYLRDRQDIHQETMTFLVRQLQGGPQGIPIEIYIFTTTTNWVEYEGIQSDIFDHCYAMLSEFHLRAFQQPTGHDWQQAVMNTAEH